MRVVGIHPRSLVYQRAIANCTTTQQRKAKLLQMLKDAGMHGIMSDLG